MSNSLNPSQLQPFPIFLHPSAVVSTWNLKVALFFKHLPIQIFIFENGYFLLLDLTSPVQTSSQHSPETSEGSFVAILWDQNEEWTINNFFLMVSSHFNGKNVWPIQFNSLLSLAHVRATFSVLLRIYRVHNLRSFVRMSLVLCFRRFLSQDFRTWKRNMEKTRSIYDHVSLIK